MQTAVENPLPTIEGFNPWGEGEENSQVGRSDWMVFGSQLEDRAGIPNSLMTCIRGHVG